MEDEKKPRLAWLSGSFGWLRNQFAEWFVGSTAIAFLMASVLTATIVVFFMDALWARNQAPKGLEHLFMAAGIAVRLWSVGGLTLAVMIWSKGAWKFAIGIGAIWIVTSVMSFGHVLGFFAEGQMQRYATGTAVEDKVEITAASTSDQLALVQRQKDDVRADRDSDVKALEVALDDLINDGDSRNDKEATDTYTALIATVRTAAREKLSTLDAQELAITQGGTNTQLKINDEEIGTAKFDPLYVWVGGWLGRTSDEATREDGLRRTAQQGASLLAVIIEALSGLGHAVLYSAVLVLRGGKGNPIYTEEEMMAKARQVAGGLKAADTVRETRNRGPKKVAQAGTKSDVNRKEYWQEAVAQMIAYRKNKMPKAALSYLVEKFGAGRTEAEFCAQVRDAVKREWVAQADYDKLLQVPAVINGAADPEDSDITPPPSEGVDDANDESVSKLN